MGWEEVDAVGILWIERKWIRMDGRETGCVELVVGSGKGTWCVGRKWMRMGIESPWGSKVKRLLIGADECTNDTLTQSHQHNQTRQVCLERDQDPNVVMVVVGAYDVVLVDIGEASYICTHALPVLTPLLYLRTLSR